MLPAVLDHCQHKNKTKQKTQLCLPYSSLHCSTSEHFIFLLPFEAKSIETFTSFLPLTSHIFTVLIALKQLFSRLSVTSQLPDPMVDFISSMWSFVLPDALSSLGFQEASLSCLSPYWSGVSAVPPLLSPLQVGVISSSIPGPLSHFCLGPFVLFQFCGFKYCLYTDDVAQKDFPAQTSLLNWKLVCLPSYQTFQMAKGHLKLNMSKKFPWSPQDIFYPWSFTLQLPVSPFSQLFIYNPYSVFAGNLIDSTFKIHPASDHMHHLHCYHLVPIHCHLSVGWLGLPPIWHLRFHPASPQ